MTAFLDRKIGPCSGRVWCLLLNFIANGVGLFGLSQYVRGEGGMPLLIIGAGLTIAMIALLSTPSE
ncbi:MAG: hypothetical protein AAF311_08195 [Pseudomonadota bacterium]